MTKKEEFEKIVEELKELFLEKNKAYGDDYFIGGYSELERWLSIKRKVTRLINYYEKGNKGMPKETLKDTWMDLAIYSIMELMIIKNGKTSKFKTSSRKTSSL